MSAQATTRSRSRSAGKRGGTKAQKRRRLLRRRALLVAGTLIAAVVLLIVIARPFAEEAVHEIALPLRHEDIIRQQAAAKDLDPSLIAGVIYVESRFRDQTSIAGAKGLMQILPSTADYIATKSGGTAFEQGDLATPQINISYGSWYLRYLLEHYDGNELLALAAYNAGEGKVDEWYRDASARGEDFKAESHIPFPETRNYVTRVLDVRERYRREYRKELGL
jgi:soluble lytic murein transglycosylase